MSAHVLLNLLNESEITLFDMRSTSFNAPVLCNYGPSEDLNFPSAVPCYDPTLRGQ